jgi:hypothetical protein
VSNGSAIDPEQREAWQHRSMRGLSRDTSTPRHRHRRTAAYLR